MLTGVDPKCLHQFCDDLTAKKIQALWKKWEARLPRFFTDTDRRTGFGDQRLMQQVKFLRT